MKLFYLGLTAAVVLLCAGCMVGPDYSKPSVPMTAGYKEDQGWKLARPLDHIPRGKWWEIFGDPQLNALEEQVTVANQDLKAAEARFRQARAMIGYARASEFPTISTGGGVSSVKRSANAPYLTSTSKVGPTGDFVLSFDLNYELDLWGRIRRTVTAAREEAQATAADLQTV